MTGRKMGLGSEVPSNMKYHCNAAGCAVTPCGCGKEAAFVKNY